MSLIAMLDEEKSPFGDVIVSIKANSIAGVSSECSKLALILRVKAGLERKTTLNAMTRALGLLEKEQPGKFAELKKFLPTEDVVRSVADVTATPLEGEEKTKVLEVITNALALTSDQQQTIIDQVGTVVTTLGVSNETKKKIIIALSITLPVVSTLAGLLVKYGLT